MPGAAGGHACAPGESSTRAAYLCPGLSQLRFWADGGTGVGSINIAAAVEDASSPKVGQTRAGNTVQLKARVQFVKASDNSQAVTLPNVVLTTSDYNAQPGSLGERTYLGAARMTGALFLEGEGGCSRVLGGLANWSPG